MQLTPELLYVAVIINRLTELLKARMPDENAPGALNDWREFILLLTSFVLGSVAVVAVFPASNMFTTAASPLAGQIATGIVVGALANGIDFAAGLGEAVVKRVQTAPAGTINFNASMAGETSKAA